MMERASVYSHFMKQMTQMFLLRSVGHFKMLSTLFSDLTTNQPWNKMRGFSDLKGGFIPKVCKAAVQAPLQILVYVVIMLLKHNVQLTQILI